MARTLRDTNLETRAARSRLAKRPEPYWRSIDPGAHLGYYRGSRGGSWVARLYIDARYRKVSLGVADDSTDADGIVVLSFAQAQAAARSWFTAEARRDRGLPIAGAAPYRVRDAMTDYLDWYARHRRALGAARNVAETHILPALGQIEVAKLMTAGLRVWHEAIAEAPLRGRRVAPESTDPDAVRRRRATANRILTVLKAALNRAWREGKAPTDDAWRRVKPFRGVDAAVVRYLSEAECARLVNAADPDFRPLVRAALLTGCRYGELGRLRAGDFNPDSGTLAIRISKAGRPRHVVLSDEGRSLFAELALGQRTQDLVFRRRDGKPWSPSDQQRPMAHACAGASIEPAISFHVLRHTHGSLLAMRGVPLGVIAHQLGHADTRMTERHYAHLAPSYVADTIRAGFPNLGIVGRSKISRIDRSPT